MKWVKSKIINYKYMPIYKPEANLSYDQTLREERNRLTPVIAEISALAAHLKEVTAEEQLNIESRITGILNQNGRAIFMYNGAGEYIDGTGDAITFFRLPNDAVIEARGNSGKWTFDNIRVMDMDHGDKRIQQCQKIQKMLMEGSG